MTAIAAATADVVVVGGGIIGCAIVWQLAQRLPRTARIVLIDRGPIAGATSGSCMGHLMVTPDDAQEYAFSHASVQLWRELQDQQGGFDYNPTGARTSPTIQRTSRCSPICRRSLLPAATEPRSSTNSNCANLSRGSRMTCPGPCSTLAMVSCCR